MKNTESAEVQKCRGCRKVQKCRSAEVQKCRSAEVQKCISAEVQGVQKYSALNPEP